MKKVSIVVPVYNSRNTLIPCVGNLVNQTLNDIEIILVNDCSTDNSLLVMKMLKERFPEKIKIIDSKVNQGPGGARNLGLKETTGEYIGFVDSDDIVDTTMFEKMYNEAVRTGYDIIDCGFYNENTDNAIIYTSDNLVGELNTYKRNELIASGGYIYTKIYKTSYFKSHDFVFRNNVILEDSEFIAYAYATAQNIGNVKEILYVYKKNENSASKMIEPMKYYHSCFEAMKAIYNKLNVLPIYNDIKVSVEYEILQMYSNAINILLFGEGSIDADKRMQMLTDIRKFRLDNLSHGYDNKYIKNKMDKLDIKIMEDLDSSVKKAIDTWKRG